MINRTVLKSIALGLAAVVYASAASPAGVSVVTASNPYQPGGFSQLVGVGLTLPPFYGEVQDRRVAQTFTAEAGGLLDQIAFRASNLFGYTTDLRVSIASVQNDQIGATLGSVLIDSQRFPDETPSATGGLNIAADFLPEQITLQQGQAYAILFSTDSGEANYTLYGSRPTTGSLYAPGSLNLSTEGGPYSPDQRLSDDLYFAVTVVPEPATAAVLVLAMGAGLMGRRR